MEDFSAMSETMAECSKLLCAHLSVDYDGGYSYSYCYQKEC
jgi:hypothetical protein